MKLTVRTNPTAGQLDRRSFLKISTLATAACLLPPLIPRRLFAGLSPDRHLGFFNSRTDEKLYVTYCAKNRYIPEALEEIDYILRDYRTGEIKPIDPALLNYLYAISRSLKLTAKHPFHIISGYRSPKTNARLRRRNRGVAKNSYHTKGKAIDIRLARYRTSTLRRAAARLQMGGVGYYPRSHFVHIDTGKVRSW
ncbi:MAG: DUF882 domain-containing protein [Deltaproteobacteria bacterium]|nr:DUF882 domain-containing protein [Deltaproteobacteria bacterium]